MQVVCCVSMATTCILFFIMNMRSFLLLLLFLGACVFSPVSAQTDLLDVAAQALGLSSAEKEDNSGVTFEVKNGAVNFVKIVEGLPLNANDIYDYSLEFVQEAYRLSKYDVTQEDKSRGFIVGEGLFSDFERYGNLVSQYTFSCKHILRVDAKDGRARISIIVKEYDINRERTNGRILTKANVTEVSPFIDSGSLNEPMYEKAFEALRKIAIKSIVALEEDLKTKQPADDGDW